jgi:hypothetical protein
MPTAYSKDLRERRFQIHDPMKSYLLKLYRLAYVAMLPAAISPPGELLAERNV